MRHETRTVRAGRVHVVFHLFKVRNAHRLPDVWSGSDIATLLYLCPPTAGLLSTVIFTNAIKFRQLTSVRDKYTADTAT